MHRSEVPGRRLGRDVASDRCARSLVARDARRARTIRGATAALAWLLLAPAAACRTLAARDLAADDPSSAPRAQVAVLRVGTSGDYAPFSKDGVGFDMTVAKRLAADFGYRIEWVEFKWPQLQARIAENAFDVAMSGVTWRPERSVCGWMSRAVTIGGPCVLRRGSGSIEKIAVNRGGVLERWTRDTFRDASVRTVDENASLPALLAHGEVDAIVTDSFEIASFEQPSWYRHCEAPRDRKVYWVSPARAAELGPRIDAWLGANEPLLRDLRARFLEQQLALDRAFDVIDLLGRRLALMPAVAAYKRAHGLPIDDPKRERAVLESAERAAASLGLEPASVKALFAEQIELAKAVQRRADHGETLDLNAVLRPALAQLGDRIVAALAAAADELPTLELADLDLLAPQLEPGERERLLTALRKVRVQNRESARADGLSTRFNRQDRVIGRTMR